MSSEIGTSAHDGPSWKKRLTRVFIWGLGFGVGTVLVVLVVYYFANRPKGWDSTALLVKHVRSEELDRLAEVNGKFEETTTGLLFTVDLENTTARDITLSKDVTVMQTAKATGALHGSLLKLDKDFLLPAHHVVSVSLQNDDLCAAKVGGKFCFNNYFKDQGQLVIFDEAAKLEIRIPISESDFTLPLPSNSVVAPPCKNGTTTCDPWERDWEKGPKLEPGTVITREGIVLPPSK